MMLGGKRKRQPLSLAAKLEIISKLEYISKLRTNPTFGHPSVLRCPAKRGKGVFIFCNVCIFHVILNCMYSCNFNEAYMFLQHFSHKNTVVLIGVTFMAC